MTILHTSRPYPEQKSRSRTRTLHGAVVVLFTTIFMISAATAATGQDTKANASECLAMWDGDLNRYYREGWDRRIVASTGRVSPFTGQGRLTFSLRCGDERSGVIHIAHADTNGTGHPIAPDQYSTFYVLQVRSKHRRTGRILSR